VDGSIRIAPANQPRAGAMEEVRIIEQADLSA
jgi:hypothetical protein